MAHHPIQALFEHVGNLARRCALLMAHPEDPPETIERDSLMRERLTQAGVDADYVEVAEPDLYHELQRICDTCPDPEACARDLARGDWEIGLREYCPNAAVIDALIIGNRPVKE